MRNQARRYSVPRYLSVLLALLAAAHVQVALGIKDSFYAGISTVTENWKLYCMGEQVNFVKI